MKRQKATTKKDIINLAKHLESGDKIFKIDGGSISEALIRARYFLEHGCSKEEHKRHSEDSAMEWAKVNLV